MTDHQANADLSLDPRSAIPLLKWVWRSYFRAALMPLLLVEVVFVIIYLTANHLATQENIETVRTIATDELRRIAQREAVAIQKQLEAISQSTDLFRRQTARILQIPFEPDKDERKRYAYSPDGVYYTTQDNGGSALFYSGAVPVGAEQREKVWRTVQLDPLMRDLRQTHPLVVQVYLNTHDSLNRIYPYFNVLGHYQPKLDIPQFNFYYEADAQHNPQRGVVWTDVYVDPAGQGWMVSSIAPVYRENFLEGVIGLDVTVATIANTILNLAIPWQGYGLLVSKTGTLLALPSAGEADWNLRELTTHAYTDYIRQDTFKPEEFNIDRRPAFAPVRARPEGVAPLELNGPQLAAWATVPETGWKLVVMVREANIHAQANQLGHRLFMIGLWMIGGIILFYGIFFAVLYRRARLMASIIAQPLEVVDNLVERIGQGDYQQQVPNFKVRELQKTAICLVAMGKQLGVANGQLRLAQEEAERARDAALEASRLKSEFLGTVSHELRTPLNSILGMLDLLLKTTLDHRQQRFALTARQSSEALFQLISDILDLSRIEAGQIELQQMPFSPTALIQELAKVINTKASEKSLGFNVFVAPQTPTFARGDEGRLRQVALNLLSNAIKFTEHGEIVLRCEPAPEAAKDGKIWLRFSVADTGVGIAPAAQARLFEPFTQLDGSISRRFGGIGLGLCIAKRLVERMGGTLGVDSEEGKGSTFWFYVPLGQMDLHVGLPPGIMLEDGCLSGSASSS
ncbi:MAG: ATP-binding protein [Candidatus Competibacter denitrificans]